jgi:hypothetical protein
VYDTVDEKLPFAFVWGVFGTAPRYVTPRLLACPLKKGKHIIIIINYYIYINKSKMIIITFLPFELLRDNFEDFPLQNYNQI